MSKGRHIHKRKEGMCPVRWTIDGLRSQCEGERGHSGDHYDAENNRIPNRQRG